MKLIIAPDSFKGSITSLEAAEAIARGINSARSDIITVTVPVADGGEGTLDALCSAGHQISTVVTGALGSPVCARFGFSGDTAIIESASAIGLTLIPECERQILYASSRGVGELILCALDKGYRKILLTVGGTGTSDGGAGMLYALGAEFRDTDGKEFIPSPESLLRLCNADISGLDKRVHDCKFIIATDVTNPLCGKNGAAYVFAPQKGAKENELPVIENAVSHFCDILETLSDKPLRDIPGCGAGGGLPLPLLAFTDASVVSGIDAVLDAVGFDRLLDGADMVITGEGRLDAQSLNGKAVSGIARAAFSRGIPVICIAGCLGDGYGDIKKFGVTDIYTLDSIAPSKEYAIANAASLLEKLAFTIALKL